MAFRMAGNFFRRALGNDAPTAIAAFRAHIDHPIRRLDDFEIVLDHHHRVALLNQFVQHFQQLGDIMEMQAVVGSSRM